jgi:hypothetical protein
MRMAYSMNPQRPACGIRSRYYDEPRSFTVLMQDNTFAWIEKRLHAGGVQR